MDEKIKLVLDNKDAALAAVESYLDKMYDLTNMFLDKGELKEGLPRDEKAESFIKSLLDDEKNLEDVRRKLIDFPDTLDIVDVNRIGLAFFFCSENLRKQSEQLAAAQKTAEEISKAILGTIDPDDNVPYLS